MLKKLVLLSTAGLVLFSGNALFADQGGGCPCPDPCACDPCACDPCDPCFDPCQEYRCGPAKCTYPVKKFRKKTYCTKRCVEEPYTVRKKCTRYRNEYYTKTYCRKVPECYYTCETRCRKRWVTDQHCKYEPYIVYKTECVDLGQQMPCCPSGGGSRNGGGAPYQPEPQDSARIYQNAQDAPITNANARKSRHY